MKSFRKILIGLIVLFTGLSGLDAQYWQQTFGTSGGETGIGAAELNNGDFLITCRTDTVASPVWYEDLDYLMRINSEGQVIGYDTLPGFAFHSLYQLENGDALLFGMKTDEEFLRPFLTRYDASGTELWTQTYRDTFTDGIDTWQLKHISGLTELLDGSILFHGGYDIGFNGIHKSALIKVSANGDLIWEKLDALWPHWGYFRFATLTSGDVIIYRNTDMPDFFTKIDPEGNVLWTDNLGLDLDNAHGVYATDDGGFVFFEYDVCYKADGDGNIIDDYEEYPDPVGNRDVILLPDGSFLSAGYTPDIPPGSSDNDFFIRRIFPPGNATWQTRKYFRPLDQKISSILQTSDGGFLLVGFTQSPLTSTDIFIIKTDQNGNLGGHTVTGTIRNDMDGNCAQDSTEQGLSGFYIVADGPEVTYAITDENGDFTMDLSLGDYDVYAISPSNLWEFCTDTLSLSLITEMDTTTISFEAQAEMDCPYLEIDIATPLLRRCFPNTYWVSYCNYGTVIAEDVSIEVILDDFMVVDSTSIPISNQIDSLYIFDVPDLEIGECGSFVIHFTLDESCDSTILGETHCVEAHIFPDDFCNIDTSWTGANVEVSALCEMDSLLFFIENSGTGDMAGALSYIIIEDEVILREGFFNLNVGEIKTILVPANGSTYRLEAEQEPNHPGNDMVSVTVEGCGENDMGEISLGYVNLYPDDDDEPFLSIDCRENQGAYDPNDKQGFPKGYGDEHFIDQNESIEYMIRFQNTGTDTAFNIKVLDTLSQYLNPITVRPGASSHDYEYSISGEGILEFRFDNIMLPDSNINQLLSNGFVKFTVDQVKDNPIGTEILNSAAIYFDFNDPVITNTTLHTIGKDYIIVSSQEVFVPETEVLVYPNPFREQVTFELKGAQFQDLNLQLYNVTGQLLRTKKFEQNRLQFYKRDLIPGIYFYNIRSGEQIIASGKIVVH